MIYVFLCLAFSFWAIYDHTRKQDPAKARTFLYSVMGLALVFGMVSLGYHGGADMAKRDAQASSRH